MATTETNKLGLALYRPLATGDENLCLSPYAIANVLAMTLAGADGQTREEMARVLHAPDRDEMTHSSFAALRQDLAALVEKRKGGSSEDPIIVAVAGRLFAQTGFDFRNEFLTLAKEQYNAPLDQVDYVQGASAAADRINSWVAEQTRDRIRNLVPADALTSETRLVLVNAIYLKAPWSEPFSEDKTQSRPFRVRGTEKVNVPTMFAHEESFGYAKQDGYTAVSLSYSGSELQFLILLPDDPKGIHTLEKKISAALLAKAAKLKLRELDLYLPKVKFERPAMDLGAALQELGMRSAFNQPTGSANFERMAPRKPNDYLFLSAVFHKTFLELDELGTEAAAGNALPITVYSASVLGRKKPKPIVVKVDRPFFYAIQHVPSGACLFLGRVTDPR